MATTLTEAIHAKDYVSLKQMCEVLPRSTIKTAIISHGKNDEDINNLLSFVSRVRTADEREEDKRRWLKKKLTEKEKNSILRRMKI